MRLILLSGGSGKRLWPLSSTRCPKQFLKILKDKDGKPESMVQRVYRQLKEAGINSKILVAAGIDQHTILFSQLGEIEVVAEPERRDTFPAVSLACAHLFYKEGIEKDETVIVLPIDLFVEVQYFNIFKEMEDALKSCETDIALIGIRPEYPSDRFGYIVPKKRSYTGSREKYDVDFFVEKPSVETAVKLIEKGAVWNGGVFAFHLGYIMAQLEERISFHSFEDINSQYSNLKRNSFDYEIVEKAERIMAFVFEGTWKDLGTWEALSNELQDDLSGYVLKDDESLNLNVINELTIPIIVLGGNNLVVVANEDGILVADKSKTNNLKQLVERLQD